jgi:NTE family protein
VSGVSPLTMKATTTSTTKRIPVRGPICLALSLIESVLSSGWAAADPLTNATAGTNDDTSTIEQPEVDRESTNARPPDVLVLGAGGILGEAWLTAVLAGLADAGGFDARESGQLIGTSAGSIVAAMLAAGADPRAELGRLPEQPPVAEDQAPAGRRGAGALAAAASVGSAAVAPLAPLLLRASSAGRVLRRAALNRVPAGRLSLSDLGHRIADAGARWDGRLRIAVVEVESGRRILLDGSERPAIPVPTAVQASCAIPGVFRPVDVAGRRYVDGGAWSPTNLDAATVERGTTVLCLNPTGSLRPDRSVVFGALGPVSRSAAAIEAAGLRRQGAEVDVVAPDHASAAAMGTNLMRSGPRQRVLAAGFAQGRRLGSG